MSSFMYLKNEQPTFVGRRSGLPCWLLGEYLLIMTPRPVAWVPRCIILWLDIFYHGWYIVAIPDPEVVYDLRAWYRCDQEQLWWLYMNTGSQKKKVHETLSFDQVKVCYPPIFILLPGQKPRATFAFSCIPSIVYIYRPIFLLFRLGLIIFIDKTSDDSAAKLRAETVYRVSRSESIIDFTALNLNKSYLFQNCSPGNNLPD